MADNSKRGLASADEDTKQKVSREGGQSSGGGQGQSGGQSSNQNDQNEDTTGMGITEEEDDDMGTF